MTSKVVKSNFFNETSIEITGASNRYDLRWNTENGDIELIQRGIVLDGSPIVLFENNQWTQWAKDNALTSGYVPDSIGTPANRVAVARKIADQLLIAHQANGGGQLPEWVIEMDLSLIHI